VFSSPLIRTLADFVKSIGIDVHAASSLLPANFPGLDIQHGAILVDETRVVYPGDILHEAGHIALSAPSVRPALRLNPTGGEELAALGWSYAATVHLGLDSSLVFYPSSYQGFGDGWSIFSRPETTSACRFSNCLEWRWTIRTRLRGEFSRFRICCAGVDKGSTWSCKNS